MTVSRVDSKDPSPGPPSGDLRAKLENRLTGLAGLSPHDASRVAAEVMDLFSPSVDEFIVTRHAELQSEGYTGPAVYEQILRDLNEWRFRAPELSVRQVRRRIYG